jgi:hypothetical protein
MSNDMSVGLRTSLSRYMRTTPAQRIAEVQQFLANREYHVSAIFSLCPALSTMEFGFIYPRLLIIIHTKNKSTTQEDDGHYHRHVINDVVIVITIIVIVVNIIIIMDMTTHLLN